MKQSPIRFNAEMVKAIQDNSKKETRRTSGLETVNKDPDKWKFNALGYNSKLGLQAFFINEEGVIGSFGFKFPYGNFGDILLVKAKETEIFLQITDIKVERLQDISETSAINEGIEQLKPWTEAPNRPIYRYYGLERNNENIDPSVFDPIASFFTLWAMIYGEDAVLRNPWVWVITFKEINKP